MIRSVGRAFASSAEAGNRQAGCRPLVEDALSLFDRGGKGQHRHLERDTISITGDANDRMSAFNDEAWHSVQIVPHRPLPTAATRRATEQIAALVLVNATSDAPISEVSA